MIYQPDKPALGISDKVGREVSKGWKSRKHNMYWQAICRQMQVNSFLKGPSPKKSWGITQLEQKPVKNNDGAANRAPSFTRTSVLTGAGRQSWV